MKDLYAILGVAPDCTPEEIKAAYRALVLLHHPDHHPDEADAHERFLALKEAYETLSDEAARAEYDIDFVAAFPGYELEGEEEEEYFEENPPARMPVVQPDASNGMLRILMVLILPILGGAVAWLLSESAPLTVVAMVGGLGAAIWIGTLLRDNE